MILIQLLLSLLSHADTQIPIKINWNYKNASFEMKSYTVNEKSVVWATNNVSKLEGTPVLSVIPDSKLLLSPNRRKKFALVAYNPTAKPIYFFAAPHTASPSEHSLGFKFKCLCMNHAFKIEPKSYWYRVVELRLSPSYSGAGMTVTHDIIGIDAETAGKFKDLSQTKGLGDHSSHGTNAGL